MKVLKQTAKVKCDFGNCMHIAGYSIVPNDVSPRQYINVCAECSNELYNELAKTIVPKSPKNFLSNNLKKGF